jgi:hypothetical protein
MSAEKMMGRIENIGQTVPADPAAFWQGPCAAELGFYSGDT